MRKTLDGRDMHYGRELGGEGVNGYSWIQIETLVGHVDNMVSASLWVKWMIVCRGEVEYEGEGSYDVTLDMRVMEK